MILPIFLSAARHSTWVITHDRAAAADGQLKNMLHPLDKLDLINYIIDTNNEVRQWQRNPQPKTN